MMNNIFILYFILFISFDIYDFKKKRIGFYSWYRQLLLVISGRFILNGISSKLWVIVLMYFIWISEVMIRKVDLKQLK